MPPKNPSDEPENQDHVEELKKLLVFLQQEAAKTAPSDTARIQAFKDLIGYVEMKIQGRGDEHPLEISMRLPKGDDPRARA